MPVLREPVAWRRPRATRGPELTEDERKHVKAALAFLKRRHGTWMALARAMGLKVATVVYAAGKRGGVSAGVALRAARAAGVPMEDVLSGEWPRPGMCPYCGRE
jgi:hypothetical protein